ncbi:MAG: hypothetical protein FJW38_01095 [Acidobacteria bacterium]|nr:hypothetical protein [Acidobacteriota bacterium]
MQFVTAKPRVQWQPAIEEDLRKLASAVGPCVTIYAPIDRMSPAGQSLRRLAGEPLDIVRAKLVRGGWDAVESERFTGALEIVLESLDLPPAPASGLGLFHCASMTRWFPIATPILPSASLGARFRLDPLCRDFLQPHEFAILVLARKHARMLRVRQGVVDAPPAIPGFPDAFEAHFARTPSSSAKPSGPRLAGQRLPRVRFGKSSEAEVRALRSFYREMDQTVCEWMKNKPVPLVLAGVTSEVAMYRRLSDYPKLAADAVTASGDGGLPDIELARRGAAAMSSWRNAEELKAAAALAKAPAQRVLRKENEIVRAASQGRVRALFVDWEHGVQEGENEPVNVAIVETLKHRGMVCSGAGPMTALLRYRVGRILAPAPSGNSPVSE